MKPIDVKANTYIDLEVDINQGRINSLFVIM